MAEEGTQQAERSASGAFISERHRNPAEFMAQVPRTNYTWAGICAIATTLIFFGLLALLWVDWKALSAA